MTKGGLSSIMLMGLLMLRPGESFRSDKSSCAEGGNGPRSAGSNGIDTGLEGGVTRGLLEVGGGLEEEDPNGSIAGGAGRQPEGSGELLVPRLRFRPVLVFMPAGRGIDRGMRAGAG